MNKALIIAALWLAYACATAATPPDAYAYRQQALAALGQLNPASILNDYTPEPPQTSLPAATNPEAVTALARSKAQADDSARRVMENASAHPLQNNPNSPEMQYAEHLIADADSVLKGGCYKAPPECQTAWSEQKCEDNVSYTDSVCTDNLRVRIKHELKTITRLVTVSLFQTELSVNLTACKNNMDWNCAKLVVDAHCEHLSVSVSASNNTLAVLSAPTCTNPVLSVRVQPRWGDNTLTLNIKVTEDISEDSMEKGACSARVLSEHASLCMLQESDTCLTPNATKMTDGLSITRACWGTQTRYHCREPLGSDCEPLLSRGCSQSASLCSQHNGADCTRFSQTFQCPTHTCLPEKTVCPSAPIGCADGACDKTSSDVSNDINDGLVHLGALGGSASEVANHQVQSGVAAIFAGEDVRCKVWPLGSRDCCTDRGWGSWAVGCPANMQALLKAKSEHRVKEVGAYTHNLLRYHTYCVFPSKLAGILQLQGRDAQLRIPFGKPKEPNCRGLSPEELERINFDALDLGALTEDFKARKTFPNATGVDALNGLHAALLHQKGSPHD